MNHPEKEGNLYDKIFKENAESIFLPLIEQSMGIKISSYKILKDKLQTTIEREMDFFYEIHSDKNDRFLLHLEFQTKNDKDMIYRMAEYHGIAFRKRKLPIKHFVINLGTEYFNQKNYLDKNELFEGFDIINIFSLNTEQLLNSQIPEVVLLAVLSNYPKEQSERILRLLIERLKQIAKSEHDFSKYLNQLLILSRLRKVEDLTIKINNDMPITIEVEKDFLYKQGIEKGIEKGIEQGIEKGIHNSIKNLIKNSKFDNETIANLLSVDVSIVQLVRSKVK
jgi:predicted transposase/invertase (TIGR01784 family)